MTVLFLSTLLQELPGDAPLRILALPMMIIALLVLMSAVLYDAMTPARVKNDPRDRPIPNLLVGSAALWALGAIVLWFFPFVREGRSVVITQPPSWGAPGAVSGGPATGGDGGASGEPSAQAIELMVQNGCGACHAIDGVAQMSGSVGPALTNAATNAQTQLDSPDYTGNATDVAGYLREGIVDPNVHVLPPYQPIMPATFGQSLSDEQIDLMVEYLATLE